MDYLPLFAAIKDRPVLVVGSGEIAERKIAFLRRAGACVQVIEGEDFHDSLLENVVLVIAATNDRAVNRRVFDAANARHRLVNVVDDQPLCSFIFPSIVDRSPLLIAISSGGNAPVLARLLREKLEALLPASLGRMAEVAGNFRERLKTQVKTTDGRRRFWDRAFRGRFASLMAVGNERKAGEVLEASLTQPEQAQGEIILVGAGPGDAGLLTLRGLQVIQQADVVFYDHLVTDGVRELIRRDAEQICVGKRAGEHSVAQHETNAMLVAAAKAGKTVVRLKGGDPFIFGRGGEELETLADANVPFSVVPGITAASGCSAYSGIPLTHRDHAQSVRLVTGHAKADGGLDWATLAAGQQTLVFYMGLSQAAEIQRRLIANGLPAATPVALVENGTSCRQRVIEGELGQLGALSLQAASPSLIIVGSVVSLRSKLNWFASEAPPAGLAQMA